MLLLIAFLVYLSFNLLTLFTFHLSTTLLSLKLLIFLFVYHQTELLTYTDGKMKIGMSVNNGRISLKLENQSILSTLNSAVKYIDINIFELAYEVRMLIFG